MPIATISNIYACTDDAGRPKSEENMSAQESARIKSFMENLRQAGERQAHILEAVAGVALVRNPGGKFIKKKCSNCGQEGHRRTHCPENQPVKREGDQADAVREGSKESLASGAEPQRPPSEAEEEATPMSEGNESEVQEACNAHPSTKQKPKTGRATRSKGAAPDEVDVSGREADAASHEPVKRRKVQQKAANKYGKYASRAAAIEEFRRLLGVHTRIAGDGRCWRYALLANLHLVDHATSMEENTCVKATATDVVIADELWALMVRNIHKCSSLTSTDRERIYKMTCRSWGHGAAFRYKASPPIACARLSGGVCSDEKPQLALAG